MKRTVSTILASCIALTALWGSALTASAESSNAVAEESTVSGIANSYAEYLSGQTASAATQTISLPAADAVLSNGGELLAEFEGKTNIIQLPEEGAAQWTFEVTESAMYQICLNYYPLTGRLTDIEWALELDGKTPFREADQIRVSRSWKLNGEMERDNNGNDIRPEQTEAPQWMTEYMKNNSGYVTSNYQLYLSKGKHTLKMTMSKDTLALAQITLGTPDKLPTYEETLKKGTEIADYTYRVEAENFFRTSTSGIYAGNDRGNPAISPSDPAKVRMNVIGMDNWTRVGQWVIWEVDIPEDGYYHIYLKYRQNSVRGFSTARRLYIDDKVPFQEVNQITFPYTSGQTWVNQAISDQEGNPYLFYMEKGKRQLKLEVVSSDCGELLSELGQIVTSLNDLYRQIIMVTGTSPDILRDYYLDQEIPTLIPTLEQEEKNVKALLEKFRGMVLNGDDSQVAFLKEVEAQLRSLREKPETIQTRLDQFRSSISSLSDLILSLQSQPLELDYLTVTGQNVPNDKVNADFFETVAYRFQAFIASFFEDYNAIGNIYGDESGKEPLEVWINGTSGRDQLTVIKQMIDNDFVPEYDMPVNVNLVGDANTLVQAILAKSGPDCAMIVPSATPINLAMRGALVDLTTMEGFEETRDWFYESAFVPYIFEDGIYAMPESQLFWMMFYRTDIMNELKVEAPDTWEDFYAAANIIMKSNLKIGIPENLQIFETFLMQNGAELYAEDCRSTRLSEQSAVNAFTEWTDIYVNYGFDTEFDALSRFRTGEMVIVLQPYTFYNSLAVGAPEISGLWEMAPLPAREVKGEMSRISSSAGNGSIILKGSDRIEDSWTFIKWWCSADAQAEFGTTIEAVMGPSARYNPANIKAFDKIGWSAKESAQIMKQWEDVSAFYNVPGNYYMTRCLTNAFRKVTIYFENPRETLAKYDKQINAEIIRKRKELKLDQDKD